MEEPGTTSIAVHAALARALADHGVDSLFGLIGDANIFMVDSFVRNHHGKFIASSHEAGAVLMAIGHAAMTGKPGAATVTFGPGLSNSLSALIEGVKGATPMVLLCGDAPVADREEISKVDQRALVCATGAGFEQLRSPNTACEDLATAFRRAAVERRPIALNIPKNLQWQETEYSRVRYRIPEHRAVVPSSEDLDDAIGIIASAKRPLVLAGRGAVHPAAKTALLKLAQRIEAPLATTLKAKDLFRDEPFNVGYFGTLSSPAAVDVILASDCIVAFGASLNPYTTSGGSFLNGKRVVHVDLYQTRIGKYVRPDAGVVGDTGLVADIMLHWLDEADIPPSGFQGELAGLQDQGPLPKRQKPSALRPGTVDVVQALARLEEAIPADRILITDGGRFLREAWRSIRVPDPQSFLPGLNFGAIGMGLPQAIGAAVGGGDRPTLLITGDGGFMLGGLVELNTAVRYGCDLIVIVCNDGSYGAEHVQFRNRDMDPGLSLFDWPDFAPVATALGALGVTVRRPEDLDAAAEAIRQRGRRPLLIDLKLDPDNMPPLPH